VSWTHVVEVAAGTSGGLLCWTLSRAIAARVAVKVGRALMLRRHRRQVAR